MVEKSSAAQRMSFFFIAVVTVLLVLSFISLYQAVETYRTTGSPDIITLFLSISAIALSSYLILQVKRKPVKLGFDMPKVSTKIKCSNCDFSNIREFRKGDFVLKVEGSCSECDGKTIISSIYRIVDEKEED